MILVKDNEKFMLGLDYDKEGTKGVLLYFPKQFINTSKEFEELTQEEIDRVGIKYIKGNSVDELKARMQEAEEQLLLIHEGIDHVMNKETEGEFY